jgi:hypothetical protein
VTASPATMGLTTVAPAAVAAAVPVVTVTVTATSLATGSARQQRHVGQGRFQRDRGLHELTFRAVVGHKGLLQSVR